MSAHVAHAGGASLQHGSSRGLISLLQAFAQHLAEARRDRQVRQELMSLTDRELDDIGLTRIEVETMDLRRPVRRD
jgi:uncharacterized protein YjiS (DUF1127 family)